MAPQIAEPRKEISKYAPKIVNMKINPEKIKDVIGSGGKVINKIIDETGVKIDIEEDGSVFIYSDNLEGAEAARRIVEEITRVYGYYNTTPKSIVQDVKPALLYRAIKLEYETKYMLAQRFDLNETHSYIWYDLANNNAFILVGIV